ncbi:hypothetical protein BDZ45DRAFT_729989 [Acephala macrosclerotiorum]|nr:hypothetical protein BDZ45DRAFT_729989 [Acephala macrosclerotiorum]
MSETTLFMDSKGATALAPPNTVVKASTELVKADGSRKNSRATPQGLLLENLPNELHHQIFDLLGPATQRLLGATCYLYYSIYKDGYYTKEIIMNINEVKAPSYVSGVGLWGRHLGTLQYQHILAKWYMAPLPHLFDGDPKQLSPEICVAWFRWIVRDLEHQVRDLRKGEKTMIPDLLVGRGKASVEFDPGWQYKEVCWEHKGRDSF